MLNLDQEIIAIDADGTEIKQLDKYPTLRKVLQVVLRVPIEGDVPSIMRWELLKMIGHNEVKEINLSEEEKAMIIERLPKVLLQIELFGKTYELIKQS